MVMFVILVPVALVGIVAPKVGDSVVITGFTFIAGVAIAVPYVVMMASLVIRRAHDFGSRGSLWIIAVTTLLILERLLDIELFRLIAIIALISLCVIPGNKVRNFYGAKPQKRFKMDFARWYNY